MTFLLIEVIQSFLDGNLYHKYLCVYVPEENVKKHKHLHIFTDIQTVILAPKTYTFASNFVWECHLILQGPTKSNGVTTVWTHWHVSIPGSKKADELAIIGAFSKLYESELCLGYAENHINTLATKINLQD